MSKAFPPTLKYELFFLGESFFLALKGELGLKKLFPSPKG